MAKEENIELIRGDPKVAIRKLSIPTMMSMLLIMIYNLTDSIWIAGLGPNAIAAVGFTTPLYFFMVGVGNAIGSGGNSLIARAIGAKDKELADNAASHTVLITIILAIIFSVLTVGLLKPILNIMNAGSSTEQAMIYGVIIFSFMFVFMFSSVAAALLRSEGDVKRAMHAMIGTAVINLILDPIFIYTLGLGISGAAWATVLSSGLSCIIMSYWIWIKKDTYLNISYKTFRYKWSILKDILNVSLPNIIESIFIAVQIISINTMLTLVNGTLAVAAYTSAKRVNQFANVPLMGICTSVLTVTGAAFGAGDYKKLKEGYNYSMIISHIIAIILASITFFGAGYIAELFTYSAESAVMKSMLIDVIKILSLFLIAYPAGGISSMLFQSVGKGMTSLMITMFRTLFFQVILAYILGISLGFGDIGIYIGVVLGCGIGSLFAYFLSNHYIKNLIEKANANSNQQKKNI